MGSLSSRKVLITGASRGIGRAIAESFAAENPDMILVGRNAEKLEETAALCKEQGAVSVRCVGLDLYDTAAVERFCVEQVQGGGVDVLINNAGGFEQGHALEGNPDDWNRAMQLNLLVPMRMTRHFAPLMKDREWGLIVNMGSVAAIEGMNGVGVYAATKHGLRGWSLSCYQQLREYGIKVVLINPAFVNTDMTSFVDGDHQLMIQPEDVAAAAKLAIDTSPACCPEEITLRMTRKLF